MNKEANKQLIKNIKLINLVADRCLVKEKCTKEDIEDVRQLAYTLFLKHYYQYNKEKSALSNWIFSSLRLRISNTIRQQLYTIRLPEYIHDIIRLHKWGKLTGNYENDILILKASGHANLSLEQYNFILRNYLSESPRKLVKMDYDIIDNYFIQEEIKNNIRSDIPSCEGDANMLKERVELILNKILSKEQTKVIKFLYGIDDDIPRSKKEIANILNISEEKVHSLRTMAMFKLKKYRNKFKSKVIDFIE